MSEYENSNSLLASRVYREVGSSGNSLVTIAIGEKYLHNWEENSLKHWLHYCEKWDMGLICIVSNLVDKSSKFWKKATWQKLLIPNHLKATYPNVKRACYLDTDILISPIAEDIFEEVPPGKIGLVSLYHSLPYNRKDTLDRIAYLRNLTSGGMYPIDSALFISLENIYRYHQLSPKDNLACMGLIVFDVDDPKIHLFERYFESYTSSVTSITDGGDQTHLNFHIQSDFEVYWLEYKWQAIWLYEAANKYPAAFWTETYESYLQDISSSLMSNFFLHFAGAWPESQIWKKVALLEKNQVFMSLPGLLASRKVKKTGVPKGTIKFLSGSRIDNEDGADK